MKIPLNVLHLEDDLRDRELVRETLEAEGIRCEIECVETREAFVDALGHAGLDLILADYRLPSFDGLSALEIAKEKLPGVPFIIVSGSMGEDPAIESLRRGATDYVLKHRMSRLRSAVMRAMQEVDERAEKAVLQKQLQAAQRMEAIGTLAGGIAHDFNNALTGILGFSELLKIRLAGNEKAIRDLDEILRCAERASTLTRQLLTFARRQVMAPVNLNMNGVVDELMKLIRKLVGEQIEVKAILGENLPTVRADRGQLEQVLMNLCINSRDAMPGGGQILVETTSEVLGEEFAGRHPYAAPGTYTVLSITDTGIGMDEEVQRRAFEPFFTTKAPEKGTGLGLSVVYGIVKQHNGIITIYSEPGRGTTFRVYLPVVEAAPDVTVHVTQKPIRGGTETVLVAEDEKSIRDLIERILLDLGYKVVLASNGQEAVEASKNRTDLSLAILDVVMPRLGGKEAFEAIMRNRPELKAIFMSGYSADAIHESFVLKAGVPFLQKPFGPTILARKVREVLDAP